MVTAARVTAGNAAVALNTASTSGQKLTIKNTDTTNGVDLGGPGVTAGTGFPLPNGAQVTVELAPGDVVYAIRSAGADVVLAVLRT
ncbi:hypothetical protein FLW53_09570 [Microbispora sp. SCL1-1]|uniref:hypothetical protein n=1 Tax=unclassified Microbispora TaxID=2614687 RepID=UPI00115BA691|nr:MULTISPECIES: hypothetical protein [unclassified Microbispora]NJP24452.1 hypothetical protein [Microbispora sp. CL1-1]TQS14598.1 hypothetical protein FLW53_09570 [Microbispora sp. SCL1-1]